VFNRLKCVLTAAILPFDERSCLAWKNRFTAVPEDGAPAPGRFGTQGRHNEIQEEAS